MQFKNLLSENTFSANEETKTMTDFYNSFFIDNKSVIENEGFKLTEEHEKEGLKIEDFEDHDKNEIRLVNEHFILYKKHKGHIYNWSCDLKDAVKFYMTQDSNPIYVRYYFNFPVGRFSDKAVFDILNVKNIPTQELLSSNIQDNVALKEQFFNVDKNLEQTIQAVCDPLSNQFNIADLIDIGYIKSSRENSYFIEENNYYFQNYDVPNLIYVNKDNKPIAKKFEREKPRGHLVLVDLDNKKIEHQAFKAKETADYVHYILYKDNQMDIEADKAVTMLKPKQKHIKRKMLPLMGYPNGYSFKENKMLWFIGETPDNMEDVTEKVESLIQKKDPETFNDVEKAYFNFYFKIGDLNDMFEDAWEGAGEPGFNELDPDAFLFIEPCLDGEHIYKNALNELKNIVQEHKESETKTA